MEDRVRESLGRATKRADELTAMLADPAIYADAKQFRDLSRERKSLAPIVEAWDKYQNLEAELSGAREMLAAESDAEMRAMAEAEIEPLEQQIETLEGEITVLLIPKDPDDDKAAVVEIRAGTGGEEAALFAAEIFRMYQRYAEAQGWRIEMLSDSESEKGGFKEVVFGVQGEGAFGKLKFESGVHRVQRVPETEASGRIHTSAVTVAVLPEAEEVDIEINEKDLEIDVYRAGGPGGQGVNTTDSAVRITHLPSGLVVTCQDERSQIKNKAKALRVLRSRLLDHARREQEEKMGAMRRSQVSTGDRSAKIRTYNFPQGRVTDHRIGLTLHKLPAVLEGDLGEMTDALILADRAERLAESNAG